MWAVVVRLIRPACFTKCLHYMIAISRVGMKLDKAACWLDGQRFTGKAKETENDLTKVVKDCSKLAEEQLKGLTNQVVKHVLFNRPGGYT